MPFESISTHARLSARVLMGSGKVGWLDAVHTFVGNSFYRCYKRRPARQSVDPGAGLDAHGGGRIVHIADILEEQRCRCPPETCWRERKVRRRKVEVSDV